MQVVGGTGASGDHDSQRREAFARVFAQHDRWLHAYLYSLLGDPASAEDVFQEVCVVLWRDYHRFEIGTSFVSWSGAIALNQVRRFRRQQNRRGWLMSDEALDLLAEEAVEQFDAMEAQRAALAQCVGKLSSRDQDLVREAYSDARESVRQVAERLNRPANTLYKALARIRKSLYDCIRRELGASSGTSP